MSRPGGRLMNYPDAKHRGIFLIKITMRADVKGPTINNIPIVCLMHVSIVVILRFTKPA